METGIDLKRRLDRRLKSGAVRTQTVGTRVTKPEELELIEAADRSGTNVSEWTRETLLTAARSHRDDALFVELIATRMLLLNLIKPVAMGRTITSDEFAKIAATVRAEKRKVSEEIQQQYRDEPAKGGE